MKRVIWTIYRKRPFSTEGEYFIMSGSGPKDGYKEMNNFTTQAEAEEFVEKLKTKDLEDHLKNEEMTKSFRPEISKK